MNTDHRRRSRLSSGVSLGTVAILAALSAGTAQADTINGTVGLDVLVGTSGEDTLRGDVGNDTLFGDVASRVAQPDNLVDLGRLANGDVMAQGILLYQWAGAFARDGRLLVQTHGSVGSRPSNGNWQPVILDLFNGTSEIVSTYPNGNFLSGTFHQGAFARDGKSLVFTGYGIDPTIGDTDGEWDVYYKDLGKKQTLKLQSAAKDGTQIPGHNRLSLYSEFDGRNVLFYARNPVPGARDTNDNWDVYMRDVKSGKVTHISATPTGAGGNCYSHQSSMSPDSKKVLFTSCATNIVPGSNGNHHLFIRDLDTKNVTRVSNNTFGVQGNGGSHQSQWSADGKKIVFASWASNMVAGDTNGRADCFVKNLETDQVTRINVKQDGTEADHDCQQPVMSPDGTKVAFRSPASNLVDNDTNQLDENGSLVWDLFVKDLASGALIRVSQTPEGTQIDRNVEGYAFTPDGSAIVFAVPSDTLMPDGQRDWETYLVRLPVAPGAADTLDGDAGNDNLYGHLGNDTLLGGPGDDVLNGGPGADAMNGGSDNDLYFVDNAGDTVIELIGGGKDTVKSLVSFTLDPFVENLLLGGTANIDATGNRANNVLTGNAGSNLIKGEAGKDLIEGLAGADDLRGGDGKDTLSYANSFDGVSVNLAIMKVSGGHAQGDEIAEFENILGSGRNDALVGDASANTIHGSHGNDTIRGGDGGDILMGGTGNDDIFGEEGADKITGGTGADLIVPGMGAGKIIWTSVLDSTAAAPDRVANYDPVNGPVIDLKRVDAIAGTPKNDTFIYIGADAFSNTAGQLRFADEKLMGDVDGDGVEDFVIRFPDVADPIPQGMIKL